jgi:hypothetical protein
MANLKPGIIIASLMLAMEGGIFVSAAGACSCHWNGPFLTASREAPLVIVAKIIRHHSERFPAMDVLVLETLKGVLFDSGLTISMGDGMLCRPALDVFPPGTTWVLALNGPGAKPGRGWAISHCGEYWLKVEGDVVIGSIDGSVNQVKTMPLKELINRFRYPRFKETFYGLVRSGTAFRKAFGTHFVFVLDPLPGGWQIVVKELGRDDNLARLTPPLHFAPNPRDIEGWHFLKNPAGCINRPYHADAGPENPRRFIFSPLVGKTIAGPDSRFSISEDDVEAVKTFGRGVLYVNNVRLGDDPSGCPGIEEMEFSVRLEGGY